MTDTSAIAQSILEFVRAELLAEGTHVDAVDDPLLDGAVDSLGLMQVVGFVEDEYDVEIETGDITETHFRTPATIAALVADKQRQGHDHVPA